MLFKQVYLLFIALASAYAASLFSTEDQKPLVNTLPGEKPIPGDNPVLVCDIDQPQLLQITSVDLTPNPPARGANLTITASGILTKDVEEGAYVDVEVKFGYIKLLTQTFDLCEQADEVDLKCPLKAEKYSLTKTVEIPNEVPPGKYTVFARAFTKDDEYITCITGTITFGVDSWKIIG